MILFHIQVISSYFSSFQIMASTDITFIQNGNTKSGFVQICGIFVLPNMLIDYIFSLYLHRTYGTINIL